MADDPLRPEEAPTRGSGQSARGPLAMKQLATVWRHSAGDTICRATPIPDCCYRILQGAARSCALNTDGRRQVIEFLLPGDYFGWRASDSLAVQVEAIAATSVLRYPKRQLEQLALSDATVAFEIQAAASALVARLQARSVTLGHSNAVERLAAFLLQMIQRSGPDRGEVLTLPMSRYDIADYLGIAVETVSRALTHLRCTGVIALDGARRVKVSDRCTLEKLGGFGALATRASATMPSLVHQGSTSLCQSRF